MQIETTRFGTITVAEDTVLRMPFGMLGFPGQKRVVMLQHKEDSPFFWYQSVDDPSLAFVLTRPFFFKPDYKVEVGPTLAELSWEGDDTIRGLDLYVVVNIPAGAPDKMTANLIGPILVNHGVGEAVQMVIPDSPYSHQYPLIQAQGR